MREERGQKITEADYDPDAGGVGYLTFDEFDRLGHAVSNARTHVAWWRIAGHIRTGDEDEHRTRSSDPTIPLPATWLAAEEVSRLLGELNRWHTLEQAAGTLDGQFFALLLVREVETSMAKWPMSDRPHKVRFLRCRACQQQTLKYFPPVLHAPKDAQMTTVAVHDRGMFGSIELADVTVKCTNKECRAVEDPAMFERDALLIKLEAERGGRGRMGDGDRGTGPSEQIADDGVQVGA